MSLSTLKGSHEIFQYNKEAFPRFQKSQQSIKSIVNDVIGSIDKVADNFKWTYKMDDPQIVVCYGYFRPSIDLAEIAAYDTSGGKRGHRIFSQLDDKVPFLIICVIMTFGSERLTADDRAMLNGLRDLPNEYIEHILFVIDQPADSLTATASQNLSDEISAELKVGSTDICHRLFCRHNSDIGIRASLYLEKQMLSNYETTKSKLKQTYEAITRLENNISTNRYFDEYRGVLNDVPFNYRLSLGFMTTAAREYQWGGSSTTRNKWKVDEVRDNIARHICERLGNQIAESLIEKFKSDVKSLDTEIADYLFKNIDVSNIRQAVYEFVIFQIIEQIWEGVKAVVTVVSTFLFTEDLNSYSFRDKVAQTVHVQIMAKKNEIMRIILDKFKTLQLPKIQEMIKPLNEIVKATAVPLESRNAVDCFYHELKMTSKRSEHIQAIGYDEGNFCVYIEDISVHSPAVYRFLSKYLKNAGQVRICEFKEIQVEEYANLQSGDKIVQGDLNNKHGTLGFLLKDRSYEYCATCRHVTLGCEANHLQVKLSDGSIKKAIDKYEPSPNLDISFLRLDQSDGNISHCIGIRNKNDRYVPGYVFTFDEFTLNPGTQVFKWGSTSNLTTGVYKQTIERLKDAEESFPWIIIKNEANGVFARKGDSGSLVCFTEGNVECAAFLLVGAYSDPGTYACCRIIDGLTLIQKIISGITHLFSA